MADAPALALVTDLVPHIIAVDRVRTKCQLLGKCEYASRRSLEPAVDTLGIAVLPRRCLLNE